MKKLIIITCISLFAFSAYSQGVKWGPRIGISTSQVSPEQLIVTNQAGLDSLALDLLDAKFGFNAGLFLRVETQKKLFFQTELHFSTTTVKYNLADLSANPLGVASETIYDLNLPVNVGWKFGPKMVSFRVQGGVILSKSIGGNTTISDIIADYNQAFKDLNVGWQGGIGFDIWKITFDAKYEGDFGKFANHMQFFGNDVTFDDRERLLKFSVGYKF